MKNLNAQKTAAEHTPEPWILDIDAEDPNEHGIVWPIGHIYHVNGTGADHFIIAEIPPPSRGYPELDALCLANARRIVACVNACAGLSTEALERMLAEGLVLRGNPGPERWHSLAEPEGK